MTTTAALYYRISVDATGQAEGVERQQDDCTRVTAARGWTVLDAYTDNDLSAAGKRKRPGFIAMMEAIEAGQVDVVVAQRWDRLSRNRRDDLRLLEACEKHGVMLSFSRGGDIDLSTPMGSMVADLLASQARNEIRIKADRQRLAAVQRSEKGRPPLGVRLTGYTPKGDLVPDEADLVREVFARFAAGDSLHGIAAGLNAAGQVTRRGGAWSPSTVRTMLTNPRYAGRAIYCGQETGQRGDWEPLVEDATFDLVAHRLADPRRKTRTTTDRQHLGSGLFLCGQCDHPVRAHNLGYRCKAGHVMRTRSHVDAYVLDIVRGRLARPDVAALVAPANGEAARVADEACKALRARLARVERDYDDDLIDGHRYKVKRAKIAAELQTAEAARMAAIGNPALGRIVTAPDPVAAFAEAPLMIRRAVVDAFVAVRLHHQPRGRKGFNPDSVTVTWR